MWICDFIICFSEASLIKSKFASTVTVNPALILPQIFV